MIDNPRLIVTEAQFNELIFWRDQVNHSSWRIGDITNEIYANALASQMEIEKMQVYSIVGQIVGKAARSIRMYATVAAFYPLEVRNAYHVLPFSHFAYAMSIPRRVDDAQPAWQIGLDLSLEYMDRHGIMPSVERLSFIVQMFLSGRSSEADEPIKAALQDTQQEDTYARNFTDSPNPEIAIALSAEVAPTLFALLQRVRGLVVPLTGLIANLHQNNIVPRPLLTKIATAMVLLREVNDEINERIQLEKENLPTWEQK